LPIDAYGRVALIATRQRVHPLAGRDAIWVGDAHSLADLLRGAPDAGDRLLLRLGTYLGNVHFARARAPRVASRVLERFSPPTSNDAASR